ncbi:MFS transporter [Streptacidiphilus sp. 4-A2]|nr:MFS transporter [Streptacidiphilus sp. 4-A2]
MVSVDTTAVNVALPALRHTLGSQMVGIQWVVDSYTLIFAATLLSAGAAGDRLGPRRVFQWGLLLFSVASAACGVSPSVWTLTLARGIQGIGAAMLVATSLPLLQAMYPTGPERARAFGIWGGVGGVAVAVGPVIGGVLVSLLGWRAVFDINVPLGILGFVVAARTIVAVPGRPRQLDLAAQAVSLVALGGITYASIEAGSAGWTTPQVLWVFVVAVLAAVAFVVLERRADSPMLDLGFFRDRAFSVAALSGLLNNFGFYGQLFVIGLFFQGDAGYSAVRTGFALLPQAAAAAAAAFLCGRVNARTGPRLPMLGGLGSGAVGACLLGLCTPHTSYLLMLLPLIAVGFAVGFTAPAAMTVVMGRVAPERGGIASGVINAARQVGSVLGVAILGALYGNISGSHALAVLQVAAGGYALAFLLVNAFVTKPGSAAKPGK